MPEAVRVVSFIKAPHWRQRSWIPRLVDRALESLDRRRADGQVFAVLSIPRDTLRAEVPLFLDQLRSALFDRRRYYPARDGRRCSFGEARHAVALAPALNGPRIWGLWTQPLAYLVGTQGRMTLTQGHHALLSLEGETIMRSPRTTRMIV